MHYLLATGYLKFTRLLTLRGGWGGQEASDVDEVEALMEASQEHKHAGWHTAKTGSMLVRSELA